jgi:hypothetical protein
MEHRRLGRSLFDSASAVTLPCPYRHQRGVTKRNPAAI